MFHASRQATPSGRGVFAIVVEAFEHGLGSEQTRHGKSEQTPEVEQPVFDRRAGQDEGNECRGKEASRRAEPSYRHVRPILSERGRARRAQPYTVGLKSQGRRAWRLLSPAYGPSSMTASPASEVTAIAGPPVPRESNSVLRPPLRDELAEAYVDSPNTKGQLPCSAARLALATILQAYTKPSDDEVIEAAVMDRRWQLVLDYLGAEEPPSYKGSWRGSGSG